MYLVISNTNRERQKIGESPNGIVISRHRTETGAERSFRRRNPHLYNRKWAEAHGYANAGTFDEIIEVDKNGHITTIYDTLTVYAD